MEFITGGVCAAKGYKASGIHCGIRKNRTKKDIALIVSDVKCAVACTYTRNLVKGAPLTVTKSNISDGMAQAVICNSGNANTCNANGIEIAEGMCELVANEIGIGKTDVVVASTGVIGQPLSLDPIAGGMKELAAGLAYGEAASVAAAEAIMTTDTVKKEVAVKFEVGGVECKIGGIAKGSGMIHPDMATMLVFITSDCAVSSEMLKRALSADIKDSFNMVSVDGDTSTNDMVCLMANGLAGNACIDSEGEEFDAFRRALAMVTRTLCRMIASDGEGATKMLDCRVSGAPDEKTAKIIAKSIICSSLVKAAMFGSDANWGRVLCAIGYSGAEIDISRVDVDFMSDKGTIAVCRDGAGVEFSEEKAKEILLEKDIFILCELNQGEGKAEAWGCDLTYDYVKINGDYRT